MILGAPLKSDNNSLVEQVIERITDAVLNHELSPGDQLPTEDQLTKVFRVGKSSVREAIKVLQALGVVEVRRGEGTFVTDGSSGMMFNPLLYNLMLEPSSLEKLIELRLIFEPAYTVLAMRNATQEDLENIRAAKERFEILAKKNQQTGYDDIEFHKSILYATHNNYVFKIGEMVLRLLVESVGKGTKFSPQQSIDDHERIYQAILSRDQTKVEEAVIKSFKGWVRFQE